LHRPVAQQRQAGEGCDRQNPGADSNTRQYPFLYPTGHSRCRKFPAATFRRANAIKLALRDVESRLQRWQDALETGGLSIEHAAGRIKELHRQREELVKKKQMLERKEQGTPKVLPIPTARMDSFILAMQSRLAAKQLGAKREFLQEVLKEVRVRDSEVTLTYKLPLRGAGKQACEPSDDRFFAELGLVGPPGLEPGTNRL
jgi:hypothetical protein